jgi:hypothetical protein
MNAVDRAIAVAAGATVVGLAGVAGAISYSHMAELARLHGETGWRAHAFPISVGGIEIVASLVLLRIDGPARGRAGCPVPWSRPVPNVGAARSRRSLGPGPVGRFWDHGQPPQPGADLRAAGHGVRNDRLGHLLRGEKGGDHN